MHTKDDRVSKRRMRRVLARKSSVLGLASVCAIAMPSFARAQFVSNNTTGAAAPTATGANASAGGYGASATGAGSTVVGNGATDNGRAGAVAVGNNAAVLGTGSIAIGQGTTANSGISTQDVADFRTPGNPLKQINNLPAGTTGYVPTGTAIGALSTVGNGGGVAIGYNNNAGNTVQSQFSTAIGANNLASGVNSIALGLNNTASNRGSIAIGTDSQSTGLRAIAMGREAYAYGDFSMAQGYLASSYGANSLAFGPNSVAGVNGGAAAGDVAIGSGATSTLGNSVALGAGSVASRGAETGYIGYGVGTQTSTGELAVGTAAAPRTITGVSAGRLGTDAVNVSQLNAVGTNLAGSLGGGAAFDPTTGAYTAPTYSVAGTNYNNVGSALTALGNGAGATFVSNNTAGVAPPVATGANSSAGGYGASATGPGSTVVGNSATDNGQGGAVAVGNNASAGTSNSIAIGQGATTTAGGGVAAVAIGNAAIAQGDGAVALGLTSNANGTGATAGGNHSSANGDSAVALGDLATAVGTSSTSFGVGSKANGESAFAAGTGATATGASAFAMGTGSSASQDGSIAFGNASASTAGNAVSIGSGANTTVANGIALGAGSTATRAGMAGVAENFSGTTVGSTQGAVSVGAAGAERQITNVAGGTQATDAVNVRQLSAVGSNLAGSLGGGAAFDATTGAYTAPAYTVGGRTYDNVGAALAEGNALAVQYTPDATGTPTNAVDLTKGGTLAPVTVTGLANATTATGAVTLAQMPLQYSTAAAPTTANPAVPSGDVTLVGTTAGTTVGLHNLAAGTLSATSTDAVNGSQLFGVSGNVDALGTTTAAAIGGNAAYTPGVGITGLSYTLNGAAGPFTNVVAGEQALANGAAGPVQYAVPGTPGNAVNLVGTGGTVTLGNVAAGALTATSTDAVNGGQLYTTNQSVAGLTNGTSGLVQQDPTSRAITVGAGTNGTTVGFANATGAARTLTGVAAGTVAAGSTEAVNGGQLAGTAGSVAAALGGGSMVNPDGTVSAPTYSVANGTFNNVGAALTALNAGLADGQFGSFRSDNTAGAADPAATGANSVAGGFGASAAGAGSTVVGNGATDNGVADATIVGNGAAVAAGLAGSNVALGQGTVATRGAETYDGYGVGTTTSAGEVAVGSPAAARTITGVAAGRLATDAANVAQLQAVGNNLAGSLGGGAAFDPTTGAYTAPAYTVGGQTYGTVGAALAASNDLAVQYTPGATGAATNAIDLTKGGTLGTVTMSGLAAGALTLTSTDAVNGSQLYATDQQLAAIAGGTAGLVQQDPASRAITVGAATDGTSVGFANDTGAARTLTGVAAGLVGAGSTQAVNGGQLYGTAGSVANALGGGSMVNTDGTVSTPTYGVDGRTYNNVGGAITALDTTTVKYDVVPGTGARAQSITLAGGDPNQPVLIHNVAAGTIRTDAANFGQVQDAQAAANQYTNQQVAGVESQISGITNSLANLQSSIAETRDEARSAAAIGLAAASLRYDDRPGKFSVAAGGGYWRGEAAGAFGVGYTLPDDRFRLSATAATSGSNVGFGAGATYTFN